MADVGRCDFKKDILPKSESVIDMIRIATYTHQMPGALEMINYCHDMGYETTINIMAVSASREDDIAQALDLVAKSPVDVIYLVDSYGSLFPEQVRRLTAQYCEVAEASGKRWAFICTTISSSLLQTLSRAFLTVQALRTPQ